VAATFQVAERERGFRRHVRQHGHDRRVPRQPAIGLHNELGESKAVGQLDAGQHFADALKLFDRRGGSRQSAAASARSCRAGRSCAGRRGAYGNRAPNLQANAVGGVPAVGHQADLLAIS